MIKYLPQIIVLTLLFHAPLAFSQKENDKQNQNNMMHSVIVTLVIPEKDKNSPDAIIIAQDKLLHALKPYKTDSITRYRFSPIIAMSIDQAGLGILYTLESVASITSEKLHQTQKSSPPQSDPENDNPSKQ
ncbi:MAG: hypothetical protein AB8D52_10155 [Gammaproteobacteria bacterium]